jgi:hypothetical protein
MKRITVVSLTILAMLLIACGSSADVMPTETLSFDGVYTAAAATITAQGGLATQTMTMLPTNHTISS